MIIRAARPDDYAAFARLFTELGVDEPTPSRDAFSRDLRPRMVVASEGSEGSEIMGYALHELLDGFGYVRNLVTAPEHRRRGIGRALMEHLRELFTSHGASSWCLNVMPSNTAAVRLYRDLGFELAYTSRAMRIPMDVALPQSDAPPLEVRPIEASMEAELEHRFGLVPGQLSSARTQHRDSDLLAFVVEGETVGLAVFRAAFPGAFPFRLERTDAAAPILETFRRRAPPRARWVQVVVEDDDALLQHLLELGATVAMEFVHMRGLLRHTP